MVERTSKPMEPLQPSSSSQLDVDKVRCFNLELGSSFAEVQPQGDTGPKTKLPITSIIWRC